METIAYRYKNELYCPEYMEYKMRMDDICSLDVGVIFIGEDIGLELCSLCGMVLLNGQWYDSLQDVPIDIIEQHLIEVIGIKQLLYYLSESIGLERYREFLYGFFK